MRKTDREVKEMSAKVDILNRCNTVRIAFFDDKYPYIVPMSFGCEVQDGKPVIYTHGAKEGKKHDLAIKNNKVCIESDIFKGYKGVGGSTTADYESIIGFGTIEIATGDDAVHGIEVLMNHCGFSDYDGTKCIKMGITEIFKITLDEFTGKKRFW